jgi:hypothetical protein
VARAVLVPLAAFSVTQFTQFAAAAAVAWQLVQSGRLVAEWFIWFVIEPLIAVYTESATWHVLQVAGAGLCANWPPAQLRPTLVATEVWHETQSPVPPLA